MFDELRLPCTLPFCSQPRWIDRVVVDQAFEFAAGQLSPVFRQPGGHNILMVLERRERERPNALQLVQVG